MSTNHDSNPEAEGHWIHAQEVESGRYFWVHSKTHDLRYTIPPELTHSESEHRSSITRRHSTHTNNNSNNNLDISPNLSKKKSLTPPPSTQNIITLNSESSSSYKPNPPSPTSRFRRKPASPPRKKKKHWFRNKSLRSHTAPEIDYTLNKSNNGSQTLPNYVVVNDVHKAKAKPRKLRAQSTIKPRYRGALASITKIPSAIDLKKDSSKYDMDPNATLNKMHHELIGYDALDVNESVAKNEYIKSNILQFLAYRYQSLSVTKDKQFKPPLNDKISEMKYFRNIEYPQYRLDTNLKITQIINQNIYDNQTPYLRIRIPFNISLNVFGSNRVLNKQHSRKLSKMFGGEITDEKETKMNEIFNIDLSSENILETTVRQFYHTICKQICGIKNDKRVEQLFLGRTTTNDLDINEDDEEQYNHHHNKLNDWSKLVIKANGLEEYIFYSIEEGDKICNYECVRYALSHQLDSNDNKCFLTLVYLGGFEEKINRLQKDYIEYEKYLNLWRKNVQQTCFQQQFASRYPWFDVINEQFNVEQEEDDYMSMNDRIYSWKKEYDAKYANNNTVLLEQYKCLFEYTIHSIMNADKLPRFNRHKHNAIIITFELQIGSISYEEDIWLTPPKLGKKHKILYKKAIYKSKNLRINTLAREVILSVIVFGIPLNVDVSDLYSVIYSSRSHSRDAIKSWFGSGSNDNNNNNNMSSYESTEDQLIKEDPILYSNTQDINKLKFSGASLSASNIMSSDDGVSTPTYTRRRQYSYGKMSEDDVDINNDDDAKCNESVFHRAFSKCEPLAYLRIPLIDDFHCYRQGTFSFHLWDIPLWKESKHEPRDPFGVDLFWRFIKPTSFPPNTHQHKKKHNICEITITIGPNPENNPNYQPPKCIAPLFNSVFKDNNNNNIAPKETFCAQDYKRMDFIVRRDPLTRLNKKERLYIWRCREKLSRTKPRALAVFLSCVDWRNPYLRSEAYKLLYKWKMPNLLSDVVELLAPWHFPDNRIKHFVIKRAFNKLSDIQIRHILLQLVQVIKIEPHNTSFTSNFLIKRGLRSVTRIGHYMYWLLKSEIDASYTNYTRFSLINEDFLVHCFSYCAKLYVQQRLVDGLNAVSLIVCNGAKNKQPAHELKLRMQHILRRMNKSMKKMCDSGISLALNPKYKLRAFNVDKCRFMGSAQAPLWLVFNHYDIYSDPHELCVLFKSGDDLRQDLLTLQIMDTMNQLWLTSGYCMRFRIYGVITTGATSGFIEIVSGARTFDDLSVNLGGGIVRGPKDETVHVKFLKNVARTKRDRIMSQDRYLRSCAGYCIASWIIGIGDRHSDNIMVHECGDLFHIDFGHFLGHFKVKKFEIKVMPGIKMKTEWNRERSPFVFLPAMKYCIKYDFQHDSVGIRQDEKNENYQRFLDLCTTAMDAIRRRHRLLLNLFALMLPSQMPELLSNADILYMRDQMQLNNDNNYDNIRQYVKSELNDSVNDGIRIFDHIVHAYVHSK